MVMNSTGLSLSPNRMSVDPAARLFCIIGADEDDVRVSAFRAALLKSGSRPPVVITYRKLCAEGPECLAALPADSVLRIESPGRDFDTYRLFLEAGATSAAQEGSAFLEAGAVASLVEDKGLILYPRQWYLGFRQILSGVAEFLRCRRDIAAMSSVPEIMLMFDKSACHGLLEGNGVSVPGCPGPVSCFDQLRERMAETGISRVFLKLRHGSAGSGIVTYQVARDRQLAISTAETVVTGTGVKLYNNRRLSRYTGAAAIRMLVDELCRHGVHVEAWFPKTGLDGRTCDCRVLMIGGKPECVVVRSGRGPLTNLHLGCERSSASRLQSKAGNDAWNAAMDTCRRVAGIFSESFHMGIDLAFSPSCRRHAVLEVNAFGDLLKDVLPGGISTYEVELRKFRECLNHD